MNIFKKINKEICRLYLNPKVRTFWFCVLYLNGILYLFFSFV